MPWPGRRVREAAGRRRPTASLGLTGLAAGRGRAPSFTIAITVTVRTATRGFRERGDGRSANRWRRERRATGTRAAATISSTLALAFPRWFVAGRSPARTSLRSPALPFRAGLHHRQGDPFAFLINAHHPDRHHVAHAHHIVRALDVAIGKLADMNKPRILEADVDEGAKIDHVEHGSLQLHGGRQVLELQDALLEDRLGQVVARVAFRPAEGLDDVSQGEFANLELLGQLGNIGLGQLGLQFRQARLVEYDLGSVTDLLEEPGCGFVAFGVDPGAVERMRGFGNLQEARGLREGGRADPLNLREEVPGT